VTSEASSKPGSAAASKRVSFLDDDVTDASATSAQLVYHRKRFASVTEEDIHSYLLHQTGLTSLLEQDEETDAEV